MTFKNQVSVWLALEIFLEVGGKSTQRLLLTSNQATRRLCRRRLRSRKVNAVQGEPGFELPDFRRDLWRWWSLYGYCGRRRGAQTALVAASCVHRDCTRRSASRVQRRSTSAARDVAAGRGEIAGGFLGGSLTVKLAEALASPFFFAFESTMCTVAVQLPPGTLLVSILAVASWPEIFPQVLLQL